LAEGTLPLSDELVFLTNAMRGLLEAMKDAHITAACSCAAYTADLATRLLGPWSERLNDAYGQHLLAAGDSMEVDASSGAATGTGTGTGTGVATAIGAGTAAGGAWAGWGEYLQRTQTSTAARDIDMVVLPSWAAAAGERLRVPASATLAQLENGLAARFGTNVSLFKDQKMSNGQNVPISDQAALEGMFKAYLEQPQTQTQGQGQGQAQPVVICVMPAVDSTFTSAKLSLQRGALYSAVGLPPKEAALRELRSELRSEGVAVNAGLMEAFYDYFAQSGVAEVRGGREGGGRGGRTTITITTAATISTFTITISTVTSTTVTTRLLYLLCFSTLIHNLYQT
jgi:hypothetical protein